MDFNFARGGRFSLQTRAQVLTYAEPKLFNMSKTALIFGTSWVRNKSVLPRAARTAKKGSAERTSSPKHSKACGSA